MKMAEGEISRENTGEYPIFLLDDVLSELDPTRRKYVLSNINNRQVIITSCEPNYFSETEASFIYLAEGKINKECEMLSAQFGMEEKPTLQNTGIDNLELSTEGEIEAVEE